MRKTRRGFLAGVAVLGAGLAGGALLGAQQERERGMPKPPKPAVAADPGNTSSPDAQSTKRALLLQNEKEFRAGVERLYALTGELRDNVLKTPSTDVLSVATYKKVEEIEKLAKKLKTRTTGS